MIRAEIEKRLLSGTPDPAFVMGEIRFHTIRADKGLYLLSDGIGRYGMRPPSERWDEALLYAEFAVLLPPDTVVTPEHPAVRAILSLADQIRAGEWLGYGHLLPCPAPYAALTLYPFPDESDWDVVVNHPDGRAVGIWLAVPLTEELLEFRLSADGAALWKRICADSRLLRFEMGGAEITEN